LQDLGSLIDFDYMHIDCTELTNWVSQIISKSQDITQDLETKELMLFEQQSLILHNTQYNKD
jgi:hypothetical protein